ncbi:HAMP domain-containing histidine kinase [bacterium]|nr:HAMP domain-containing histidine kinase [bacterium]
MTPGLTSQQRRFAQLQWYLTAIFSASLGLIILLYTGLFLRTHHRAKTGLQMELREELSPVASVPPAAPNLADNPDAAAKPAPPWQRADCPPAGFDWSQPMASSWAKFDRQVWSHLTLFGLVTWSLGTIIGYFAIGALLRPARTAAAAQQDFLANASHELKTPITTIKTELNLLASEKLSSACTESLTVIRDETTHMQTMVEKLLTINRLTNLPRRSQHVNLPELIKKNLRRYQKTYRDAKIEYVYNGPFRLPVRTDSDQLTVLIGILLDNAGKYAQPGTTVLADLTYHARRWRLQIINEGVGIDERDRTQIFQRFYRATDSRVQAQTGSGLGLSIAQDISHDLHLQLSLISGAPSATTFQLSGKL